MRFIPVAARPLCLALAAVSAFSLGACNRQEDPAETSRDMSEERREGNENVADAQKDAAENLSEGTTLEGAAGDAYKVEVEKIRADYEVAKERCDGVAEPDKTQCRADADTAYDSAMKAADAKRKSMEGATTPVTAP